MANQRLPETADALCSRAMESNYSWMDIEALKNSRPRPIPSTERLSGIIHYPQFLNYLWNEVINHDAYRKANTVIVITDNRNLNGLTHWPHVARMLHERLQVKHQQDWTAVFVPLNQQTGLDQVHYTWGAVYVMEALIAASPNKSFIMMDHDAAFTALYELDMLKDLVAPYTLDIFGNSILSGWG